MATYEIQGEIERAHTHGNGVELKVKQMEGMSQKNSEYKIQLDRHHRQMLVNRLMPSQTEDEPQAQGDEGKKKPSDGDVLELLKGKTCKFEILDA